MTVDHCSAVTRVVGGIDLRATLAATTFLARDPTVRLGAHRYERATLTPEGPATVRVAWEPGDGEVAIHAWGSGRVWLLDRIDGLLGAEDDVAGFDPPPGLLRDAWRRHRSLRLARTRTLWHDLAWLIVQQRVTLADAAEHWATMVGTLGEPAPGVPDLRAPPTPEVVRALSYADFHPFGIERQRAEALRNAARLVGRIENSVDGPFAEAAPKLSMIRGVGRWTMSSLESLTWGSADAVVLGDDGIPSMITWLLAGEPRGADERMLELLEPFRPHRYRVIRLAFEAGVSPPRRHHRYARHRIQRR